MSVSYVYDGPNLDRRSDCVRLVASIRTQCPRARALNVLVTGGAGYVGSTLVPLLLAGGHRVRVLDSLVHGGAPLLGVWSHPAFELVHADIRDDECVRNAMSDMDAVIHLAAIVGDPACARQPDLARAVNLNASLGLVRAAERAGIEHFVFASTCSNYGKMRHPERFVDEDAELRPISLYAEAKVAVELDLLEGIATSNMRRTALRFATVFGVSPRMRFDLTVNEFTLRMLVEGKLEVYGEQFWRPYIHVRDAARAIHTVLDAAPEATAGRVFNVGSTEQNHTKKDLVEMIRPFAPDADVQYVHRDEDPRDYRVTFERIRETLGFTVTRSVEDGIREVVQLATAGVFTDPNDPTLGN